MPPRWPGPTHLLLVHVLPHDAGKEAVLHYLLGILGAPTKPAEDMEATVMAARPRPTQGSDRLSGPPPAR